MNIIVHTYRNQNFRPCKVVGAREYDGYPCLYLDNVATGIDMLLRVVDLSRIHHNRQRKIPLMDIYHAYLENDQEKISFLVLQYGGDVRDFDL